MNWTDNQQADYIIGNIINIISLQPIGHLVNSLAFAENDLNLFQAYWLPIWCFHGEYTNPTFPLPFSSSSIPSRRTNFQQTYNQYSTRLGSFGLWVYPLRCLFVR